MTAEDGEFFERYGFAVTVSLDGIGEIHNRLRPTKGGRGSYDRVISQCAAAVSAAAPHAGLGAGDGNAGESGAAQNARPFHRTRFPLGRFFSDAERTDRRGEMQAPELQVLLDNMIACGREFERRVVAGESYPFANITTALQRFTAARIGPIRAGQAPATSAFRRRAACSRATVLSRTRQPPWEIWNRESIGGRQRNWLAERMVDRQEPCRNCWARYLCGGGCHYEVIHRGRPACDYIRGWLDYALGAYIRTLSAAARYVLT